MHANVLSSILNWPFLSGSIPAQAFWDRFGCGDGLSPSSNHKRDDTQWQGWPHALGLSWPTPKTPVCLSHRGKHSKGIGLHNDAPRMKSTKALSIIARSLLRQRAALPATQQAFKVATSFWKHRGHSFSIFLQSGLCYQPQRVACFCRIRCQGFQPEAGGKSLPWPASHENLVQNTQTP